MPSFNKLYRVKIWLFHPVLIKIKTKEKDQLWRDNEQCVCNGTAAWTFHFTVCWQCFALWVFCCQWSVSYCLNFFYGWHKKYLTDYVGVWSMALKAVLRVTSSWVFMKPWWWRWQLPLELIQYVSLFDMLCFTETFLAYQNALDCFPSFVQFTWPAVILSKQGRRSGGVLILVRRALENSIEVIYHTPDYTVVLKCDKSVFSSDMHVIVWGTYVCPPDSPYYKLTHGAAISSISVTEQCLLYCAEKYKQSHFLLCRDFNERTGNLNNSLQKCEERRTHEFIQSVMWVQS